MDPNWLLSSTAQSAAAIVAIVGGFLVSRVVSIQAEANQLQRRRNELSEARDIREEKLEVVYRGRLAASERHFRVRWLPRLVSNPDTRSVARMLTWTPPGSDASEMQGVAHDLVQAVLRAFEHLEHLERAERNHRAEHPQPGDDTEIFGLVRDKLNDRFRGPDIGAMRFSQEQLQQAARIAEEERLKTEILFSKAEQAVVDRALEAAADVPSLIWGAVVLAFFGAVGVILPLILMSRRPVPNDPGTRLLVVVAFCLGFLAVLLYISGAIIRFLRRT